MGARINYVFKDVEDEASVVLYSHWVRPNGSGT
jgi:hypothetical protein